MDRHRVLLDSFGFDSVAAVAQWVEGAGGPEVGELALRNLLASSTALSVYSRGFAMEWIQQQERARADAYAGAMLAAAHRSAAAAERAARWAFLAAVVSLGTGVLSAAATWLHS